MESSDIILRKIIVHILDTSLEAPVISAGLIPTDKEHLNTFLHKHIFKLLTSDEKKNCVFYEEDSEVYHLLQDFKEENLKEVSEQMAYKLFGIMKQNPSIPSADFVAVTYQYRSEPYLALLKMNYRENYVHFTRQADGEQLNDIIYDIHLKLSGGREIIKIVYEPDVEIEEFERKLSSAEEKVDIMLKEATVRADRRGEKIIEEAKEKADVIVRQAQTEAALERKKATEGIKQEIVDISTCLSEKILEREIKTDDHKKLIDSFISEIGEGDE